MDDGKFFFGGGVAGGRGIWRISIVVVDDEIYANPSFLIFGKVPEMQQT